MPDPRDAHVVHITNDIIDTLLSNASVVALVPCLQHVREVSPSGCCTGNTGAVTLDYQAVKDCIAMTDSSSIQIIRGALHAKAIVVHRQTTHAGRRVSVKHTRT